MLDREPIEESTNQYLTSPERNWDETDHFLEGQLQAIQQGLETPNSYLAKQYGLERPSHNLTRVLAYAELLDQNRYLQTRALTIADRRKSEYEDEKARIKQGPGKEGIKRRNIDEMWRDHYNPQINAYSNEAKEFKTIEDSILRKAVLDFFSVTNHSPELQEPLVAQNLAKLIREARELFSNTNHSSDPGFEERKPIDYLVDSLSNYLSKTNDSALFTRYAYRKSPDLITKMEDCKVLEPVLSFTLNSNPLISSEITSGKFEKLGRSLISFLTRRATYSANTVIGDEFPYTSLVYDIVTASVYMGNKTVINAVANLIDTSFTNLIHTPAAKREFEKLSIKRLPAVLKMYTLLDRSREFFKTDLSDIDTYDSLPPEVIYYFTGVEHRLHDGLSLFIKGNHRSTTFRESKVISDILSQISKFEARKQKLPLPLKDYSDIHFFLATLNHSLIQQRIGIEVDLGTMLPGSVNLRPNSPQKSILETIGTYNQIIRNNRLPEATFNDTLTRHYLLNLFGELNFDSERASRENEYLWEQILNNQTWFVSPRGDRFSKNYDPELESFGIESLTFLVDKRYPREHLVEMHLMGVTRTFSYRLDINRKLLNIDRYIVSADIGNLNNFTNILLRRLYYITSGLLSSNQLGPIEHGDDSHTIEYKRAHYRYLISTDNRPITMESHGAQVHAREVLEDYGIDIYAEIRRRRSVGTLALNEFLTFVRETQPEVRRGIILPNYLVYNPELVVIPV